MRPRAELEQALRAGRSVLLGERMITRIEDLPSEADLATASGDERRAAAERVRLQAEIDRLNGELGLLRGTQEPEIRNDEEPVKPKDEPQPPIFATQAEPERPAGRRQRAERE